MAFVHARSIARLHAPSSDFLSFRFVLELLKLFDFDSRTLSPGGAALKP